MQLRSLWILYYQYYITAGNWMNWIGDTQPDNQIRFKWKSWKSNIPSSISRFLLPLSLSLRTHYKTPTVINFSSKIRFVLSIWLGVVYKIQNWLEVINLRFQCYKSTLEVIILWIYSGGQYIREKRIEFKCAQKGHDCISFAVMLFHFSTPLLCFDIFVL